MILTLLIPAADKEIDFSRSGEKRIGNRDKKTDGPTAVGFFVCFSQDSLLRVAAL